MLGKIMVKGMRETKIGGKMGKYLFPNFWEKKIINGNTIEAFMQKFVKIVWKMKTWTPRPPATNVLKLNGTLWNLKIINTIPTYGKFQTPIQNEYEYMKILLFSKTNRWPTCLIGKLYSPSETNMPVRRPAWSETDMHGHWSETNIHAYSGDTSEIKMPNWRPIRYRHAWLESLQLFQYK